MKLCRIGNVGNEKPALIDNENNYRDLSSLLDDLNPETLNFDTIEKIKKLEIYGFAKTGFQIKNRCLCFKTSQIYWNRIKL